MILRESLHRSGDYLDIDIFPYKVVALGRSQKLNLTSETQRKLNERNTKRCLTWIIQENFTPNDVFSTLCYPENRYVSPEQGKKDLENFLRRVRYAFNKRGLEFKYVSKTEIGKKNKRVHHHIVCSGDLGRDFLEQQWNKKRADIRRQDILSFTKTGLRACQHISAKIIPLHTAPIIAVKTSKDPKQRNTTAEYK